MSAFARDVVSHEYHLQVVKALAAERDAALAREQDLLRERSELWCCTMEDRDAQHAEWEKLYAERDALKEQLRIAEDRLAVAQLDRRDIIAVATAQEAQLAEAVRLLRGFLWAADKNDRPSEAERDLARAFLDRQDGES